MLSQPMSVSGQEINVVDSNSYNSYTWNATSISSGDEDEEDDDPRMLKNIIKKDIENIKNTEARLGAKIYVSGYSVLRVPGDLGSELVDAYTDFNTRCSELGEGYSYRAVDERATGFGENLELDMIVTDQTPFVLSECWCFTERGYKKEGNKCVKK